jgi:tetratricopeptide (TPR) repeat protein
MAESKIGQWVMIGTLILGSGGTASLLTYYLDHKTTQEEKQKLEQTKQLAHACEGARDLMLSFVTYDRLKEAITLGANCSRFLQENAKRWDFAEFSYWYGEALARKGDKKQALRESNSAYESGSDHPRMFCDILSQKGQMERDLGDYEAATNSFRELLLHVRTLDAEPVLHKDCLRRACDGLRGVSPEVLTKLGGATYCPPQTGPAS